jgi:hypothetical protein
MRIVIALVISLFAAVGYAQQLSPLGSPFQQLYSGFDGPHLPKSYRFDSADAVRQSWVAFAVPNELERILPTIDFGQDVLVAVAVGGRENVNVLPKAVAADGLLIFVSIGVNMPDCGEPHAKSYPFVLVAVPKPKSKSPSEGYDLQNYGNGCLKVMTGIPNDPAS